MAGGAGVFVLFVALVLVGSLPFWALGRATGLTLPANLPVTALQVVVPALAALALAGWAGGRASVGSLLRRMLVGGRNPSVWWVAAVFVPAAAAGAAYASMRCSGRLVPEPQVTVIAMLLWAALFLVAAACEEVGWTLIATDALRMRLGVLVTGTVVGIAWALWHVVGWLHVNAPSWVLWQCLHTVVARIWMVWLYERAGRVAAVPVLFHTSVNVSYASFPVHGSHYDPALMAILTTAALAMTSAYVGWHARWGPGLTHPP